MIYIYNMKYTLLDSEKKHQKEYEIGRFLLRKGLKDLYGIELELEDLENFIIKNKYGKPSFKDMPKSHFDIEPKKYNNIFFNISHSANLVVCAFYDKEIGVDIEKIDNFNSLIIRKILTDKEKVYLEQYRHNEEEFKKIFFSFWTLKESYLKYKGSGFSKNPLDIEFLITDNSISCNDENVSLIQDMFFENYILSLCFEKKETPTKENIIYVEINEKIDF